VWQSARQNPAKLYIGIDANARALERISEKIYRGPSKGGSPNALFIQASVEDIPDELMGVASEIYVHFPWGSLLRAVATGDKMVLGNLRRICCSDALLKIVIGLDSLRDASELRRVQAPTLTKDYIDSVLVARYQRAGFTIIESGTLPQTTWSTLSTSWAKRLKGNLNRPLIYIAARARLT
jgi:16S rRNA (adenine(1408)-N(1))-methyltransferase